MGLGQLLALAGAGVFATGMAKAGVPWSWWEASGSQLMTLGVALIALAAVVRAR